jgi:hypothetical protein
MNDILSDILTIKKQMMKLIAKKVTSQLHD